MLKLCHQVNTTLKLSLLSLFIFVPKVFAERIIQQNYEQSIWQVNSDPFYCELTQTLDEYAQLSVTSKPSEPQALSLKWLLTDREITDVQVFTRRADWQRADSKPPELTFFSSKIEQQQVFFYADIASLLRSIKQGFWLDAIVGFGDEQLQLTFTNTFSDNVISQYQDCRRQLAPLSWQQARDYEISFQTGERIVKNETDLAFLEKLVRYIALDEKVSKVMIDGHTDNVGSPLANRLLSKERADDVAARLVEFGLPEKMIEVRAHGQRYPVANNHSKVGQSSNRRVLVRLFRRSS
ncbi:OmpA family protein [Pseudoalteromonas mariniglutinosa]|uniref:MotY family protein n=1 Tax=Pseudoalteromonas mariniglutinosa TaxID=206042 RepID=UPI00384ACD03